MGKKLYSIFLCCVLLTISIWGCGKSEEEVLYEQRVFRNIHWGMSPEEVRERETAQFAMEKSIDDRGLQKLYLLYNDVGYLNRKWTLRYFFFEDQCYGAEYISDNDVNEYEQVRNELILLYGEPKKLYKNELDTTEFWGGSDVIPYRYLSLDLENDKPQFSIRFVFMPFVPLRFSSITN